MAAAADAALGQLCTSAASNADEALSLLSKLLANIVDHPTEAKYRRFKPDNAKLRDGLFQFAGAVEFLGAVGFGRSADGALEYGHEAVDNIHDACSLVKRRVDSRRQDPVAAAYRATVSGGAHGAGLAELEAAKSSSDGVEALNTLERVLMNIRRYPDSDKYRCVNLSKAATQKLLAAVPLMRVAGFVEGTLPSGEKCMELKRVDTDVLDRVYAMVMWAILRNPPPELRPANCALEHALGAALGAAIGDALGAPLGGRGPFEVTAAEVDKAMEMCGGGFWAVAPGQITGITELSVVLAEALADMPKHARSYPDEELATRYGKWGQSQPFRADRACRQAFHKPLTAAHMTERARESSQKCMGSGSMTRSVPLGILGAVSSPAIASAFARADAVLSHPDPSVGNAGAAYAVTIANLISAAGDRSRALGSLQAWLLAEMTAAKSGCSPEVVDGKPAGWTPLPGGGACVAPKPEAAGLDSWAPPGERLVAMEAVEGWIRKAFAGDGGLIFSDSSHAALLDMEVGSVEIPFVHAFRLLHQNVGFEEGMRMMLAGAGDACTNAAAVGGLLGAAVGLRGIPVRWVRSVLACDVDVGHFRPPEYRANRLPELVQRICARAA